MTTYECEQRRIEYRKETYHKGMRIRLISMDDMHAPPAGTLGTVQFVDDMGTVHTHWDNGSHLGAATEDEIEVCRI